MPTSAAQLRWYDNNSVVATLGGAGTLTAATFSGALSGNATAATTLQTSRTINGVAFNGSANITVADGTKMPTAGGTLAGQLVSTRANDTANGGGQIFLNAADSNRLQFGSVGIGAPSLAPRSLGTKITFYPECSATLVDYGMGVDAYTLWSSVPAASSTFKFSWCFLFYPSDPADE